MYVVGVGALAQGDDLRAVDCNLLVAQRRAVPHIVLDLDSRIDRGEFLDPGLHERDPRAAPRFLQRQVHGADGRIQPAALLRGLGQKELARETERRRSHGSAEHVERRHRDLEAFAGLAENAVGSGTFTWWFGTNSASSVKPRNWLG